MLEPGMVPDREPRIRVGIILPEDGYTSISMEIPDSDSYQLRFAGRSVALRNRVQLTFECREDFVSVELDSQTHQSPDEMLICPIASAQGIEPGQGIHVRNVISGRDFHWKKHIDVSYAGTLIVRKHEGRLIVINELPIEQYLMCVATSEMGAASPRALIEAQTITARSWMLSNVEQKHVHLWMDVCNDDCCQRYQGTTFLTPQSIEGAMNTYGQVLMFNRTICDARYSKSCGGMMEAFENVWDGKALPYLQVKYDGPQVPQNRTLNLSDERNCREWIDTVPDTFCSPHRIPEDQLKQYLGTVDEQGTYFRWNETITQDQLRATLEAFQNVHAAIIHDIEVLERGGSGRAIRVVVKYEDQDGAEAQLHLNNEFSIRQTLHKKFLYSSAFVVEKANEGSFELRGGGWGHGVGLCQIGALGMALEGCDAPSIVEHYFPGSVLTTIY